MIEVFEKIIVNVLTSIYQPFGFAIIMAVCFMFVYMFAKEHGWKEAIKCWLNSFKINSEFRRVFLLTFYTVMILFRTLLNRNMWTNPVSNIKGIWGLYNAKGELTTEVVENLILFVPFAILLLWCFREKILGQSVKFLQTLRHSMLVVFIFSLTIEFLQLFLRLGTFQLSDLFYNSLGGLLGGLIYWIGYKLLKEKNNPA